jgi:hypothetical protein
MDKLKKLSLIGLVIIILSIGLSLTAIAYEPYDYYDSDEFLFGLFGLGLAICLAIVIIPLIIAILVAIWLYKDAEKRGKSGVMWVILLLLASLLLSFIGFVIVLIVWFVTRPPIGGEPGKQIGPSTGRNCPACGRPIPMDSQVCPYCGKDFRPPTK